ncbi:MAG: T9SS type A sorting domain-containing protein [Bacteroidota bacterium]
MKKPAALGFILVVSLLFCAGQDALEIELQVQDDSGMPIEGPLDAYLLNINSAFDTVQIISQEMSALKFTEIPAGAYWIQVNPGGTKSIEEKALFPGYYSKTFTVSLADTLQLNSDTAITIQLTQEAEISGPYSMDLQVLENFEDQPNEQLTVSPFKNCFPAARRRSERREFFDPIYFQKTDKDGAATFSSLIELEYWIYIDDPRIKVPYATLQINQSQGSFTHYEVTLILSEEGVRLELIPLASGNKISEYAVLYPNPVGTQLYFSSPKRMENSMLTWEITSIDGKVQLSDHLQVEKEPQIINTSKLHPGFYVFSAYSVEGERLHQSRIFKK